MSVSPQVLGLECWQFKVDYSGAHPGSYRGEYGVSEGVGGPREELIQDFLL